MSVNSEYEKPDNTPLTQERTNNPDISSTSNYVQLRSVNIYEFMNHAYYGNGHFRDGAYLVNHPREMFYDARRDLSYYKNYIKPIIRGMVDPVFNIDIVRDVYVGSVKKNEGLLINKFIDDCDNAGTYIHEFMNNVMTINCLHGTIFVIVDNYSEHAPDKKTAIDERKLPYCYIKTARDVHAHDVDVFGQLRWIEFNEGTEKRKSDQGVLRDVQIIAHYGADEYYKYELGVNDDKIIIEDTRRINEIGVLPIVNVAVGTKQYQKQILVDPPLYDIARLNHAIFNKDSEIRDLERAQGFCVFYVQSDRAGDSMIGTHNALFLPMDTNIAPGFASPNPAIMSALMESSEKLREDLFRIASQNGVVQGVQAAKSGVAIRWEYEPQNTVLIKTSRIAEEIELKIMELFKLYTDEQFEYIVNYPSDFKPGSNDEVIDTTMKLLDMDLPELAAIYAKKEAYQRAPYDKDSAEYAAAIESFGISQEDAIGRINAGE